MKAPVVYRGNPHSSRMIIGEAPGKGEDKDGLPFVGPAGKLMDKILRAGGWDPEADWYWTNVTKCRPIAHSNSGKQNFTPLSRHRQACRPYIDAELEYMSPRIALLVGASAAKEILEWPGQQPRMADVAGKLYFSGQYPETAFYVIYHPAWILHQRTAAQTTAARKLMWEHIQQLQVIMDELESGQDE